jgi:hypothetical protein
MRESWSVHNDKLQLMESLRLELQDVCTVNGQVALESSVNQFDNRLQSLRSKCDQMIERMTNSSMIMSTHEPEDEALPSSGFYGAQGLECNWLVLLLLYFSPVDRQLE